MTHLVKLPDVKRIRAEVIRDHLPPGVERIVCLSCGHASQALQEVITAVPVVAVDHRAPVRVDRELSINDLWTYFGPEALNATSGYLPLDWIEAIGQRLIKLIPSAERYFVPCGSGETLLALSYFIPINRLVAVTAAYPPIEMIGPLSRWIRANVTTRHAGRVGSVKEALDLVAKDPGIALCWE